MTRLLGLSFCMTLLCLSPAVADENFAVHKKSIRKIESDLRNLDLELKDREKEKGSTRDTARREEVLQRIIEIHSELISLRSDLDRELRHVRVEHFEEGQESNILADVQDRQARRKPSNYRDPVNIPMDHLFRKIQWKYSSFLQDIGEDDDEYADIDRVERTQRGKRRSKEAGSYLRTKSRVKISK